jgi:hypothetical protein
MLASEYDPQSAVRLAGGIPQYVAKNAPAPDLDGYAKTEDIPTKTSDLTNDSGFLTAQTGVTGVKGDAESSYRHGDVNITPANIGAVSTSDVINIAHGGTGATYGTIDITDYCVFPNANKFVLTGVDSGRLYYNPYLNCVFGTLHVAVNTIVDNQEALVYLKKDASGTVLRANRPATCGGCIHNYQVTMTAMPRINEDVIYSSHQLNISITSPVYTIMAFLG